MQVLKYIILSNITFKTLF